MVKPFSEYKHNEKSINQGGRSYPLITTLVIRSLCIILGIYFNKPYLWIPISSVIATIIYAPFHSWCISSAIGSRVILSISIKTILSLIGFYASVGSWASYALLIYWFVFLK